MAVHRSAAGCLLGIGCVVGALALSGCGDDQDPEGASDLLDRMRAEDYQSWERAPGYESPQTSNAPHGDEVVIFVNDVVAEALASEESLSAWPKGSLIAKDGTEDGEIVLISAMEKRDDGWFWAEWDGDGESIYSGKPELCTDCHASGDDFVLAFGFP